MNIQKIYHEIIIKGGRVLKFPTSIPDYLLPFIYNKNIDKFKEKVKNIIKKSGDA